MMTAIRKTVTMGTLAVTTVLMSPGAEFGFLGLTKEESDATGE